MLATGGGLVFTGKLTGEFLALDEDTGKTLWQFQTSSSVNSTAITYTHKGRQYVTVASGLGGILASRAVEQHGADRRLAVDVRADAGIGHQSGFSAPACGGGRRGSDEQRRMISPGEPIPLQLLLTAG